MYPRGNVQWKWKQIHNTPVVMCHNSLVKALNFGKIKNIWQINEDEVCNVCIKKLAIQFSIFSHFLPSRNSVRAKDVFTSKISSHAAVVVKGTMLADSFIAVQRVSLLCVTQCGPTILPSRKTLASAKHVTRGQGEGRFYWNILQTSAKKKTGAECAIENSSLQNLSMPSINVTTGRPQRHVIWLSHSTV